MHPFIDLACLCTRLLYGFGVFSVINLFSRLSEGKYSVSDESTVVKRVCWLQAGSELVLPAIKRPRKHKPDGASEAIRCRLQRTNPQWGFESLHNSLLLQKWKIILLGPGVLFSQNLGPQQKSLKSTALDHRITGIMFT